MPPQRGINITFWGTVAAVWTALKLKKEYDEYNAVATNDAEGRIQLPNTPGGSDEDDVSMLDTNIRVGRRQKKKAGCCMCCGLDCTLFWKAFGLVLALWSLYGAFKLARWAVTPTPTGLEGLPVFGKDLGCDHASVFYKDSPDGFVVNAPVVAGETGASHNVKLVGSGVGTLIITNAPADATEVSYNIVMKGTDTRLLDLVDLSVDDSEGAQGSSFAFNTPRISKEDLSAGKRCIRFDVVLSVPSNLKELYIAGYSNMQVKFDENAHVDLDQLSILLHSNDKNNMILPQSSLHAFDSLSLEVYSGWIVGEVSVSNTAIVNTQRGDGVANVKVYPTAPAHSGSHSEKPATLRTATGSGRSDFFYITDKANKRRIESRHVSSKNGDVYLRYGESNFDGKIALSSKSSSIWGAVTDLRRGRVPARPPVGGRDEDQWTHIRGDGQGEDRLYVESNGWTGLYF